MLHVKLQQLVSEVQSLAAVFDTLCIVVNLEQEQNIALVNLVRAVIKLQKVIYFSLNVCLLFQLDCVVGANTVFVCLGDAHLKGLVFIKIALKQAVVQFDAGQTFSVEIKVVVCLDNILQEFSQVVGVVNKDLKQVFNFDLFVRL